MNAPDAEPSARRSTATATPTRVGRYELVARLGGGGMATVHLARALGSLRDGVDFERLAAVKILHPHLAADRGFVEMFLHEARVAAGIRHPNVVTILDLGVEDGLLYNVMEYVEGDTLAAIQATAAALGRGVPLGVTLRAASDVLAGLHAAHELRDDRGDLLNVVHRDVTPQNVLLGVDGVTRLTDFGIARARGRLVETSQGMLKGKLAYMSPEQLEGAEIDRRADVFAMGVTLWETLALRRLFPGRTTYELARRNARAAYRPLRDVHSALPRALDDVCACALAHDRDARFPTAAAFADALETALGATVAHPRDVGAFIASVARAKLERERAAVRASPRRAARAPLAPRATPVSNPLVRAPQPRPRRTRSAVRATTLPAHGPPQGAPDEIAPVPPSPAAREPARDPTPVAAVRWSPLQVPPAEPPAEPPRPMPAWVTRVVLALLGVVLATTLFYAALR